MSPVSPSPPEALYPYAVTALARLLAAQSGEELHSRHSNVAKEILWPHLSDELRSKLVLR